MEETLYPGDPSFGLDSRSFHPDRLSSVRPHAPLGGDPQCSGGCNIIVLPSSCQVGAQHIDLLG